MKIFLISLALLMILPGDITKDELLGKFNPATHPDFIEIDPSYTSKAHLYMRKEAYDAFKSMHAKATQDGVKLTILSATRNFDHQKGIWERKWTRTRYMGWPDAKKVSDIMTYSSMPGTSRHHWGTDIDLNALENDYFEKGSGLKTYEWLNLNAPDFGFYQTYTSKDSGRSGYEEEKWHWSYMPLAEKYLQAYRELVGEDDITGFHGSELADSLRIFQIYVEGIATPSRVNETTPNN
jgi:zinc D-Ala-D-Ala carboxypeptidase